MSRPAVSVVMPFAGDAGRGRGGDRDAARARHASGRRADPRRQLGLPSRAARRRGHGRARDRRALARARPQRRRRARRAATGSCSSTPTAARPRGLLDAYFAEPVAERRRRARRRGRRRARRATRSPRATAPRGASSARRRTCATPTARAPSAANLLVGARRSSRSAASTRASARPRTPTSAGGSRQAGWRLELRPRGERRAPLPRDVRELRRQWRGYAAGRAWLAPPLRRLRARAGACAARSRARGAGVRRAPPARRGAAARVGRGRRARRARCERGGYLALDALLGVEELAGLCAVQPARGRSAGARAPAQVVLVADRFPARGDPLVDFARTLERRPRRGRGAPGRRSTSRSRASSTSPTARTTASRRARLALGVPGRSRHPLRCALRPARAARPASRRCRRSRPAARCALERDAAAPGVHRARRRARLQADRARGLAALGGPCSSADAADARPGRRPVGVHAALRPRAVRRAGARRRRRRADHQPLRLRRGRRRPTATRVRELVLPPRAGRGRVARCAGVASSPSTCRTCCATGALARRRRRRALPVARRAVARRAPAARAGRSC